jgi:hypothetical protein
LKFRQITRSLKAARPVDSANRAVARHANVVTDRNSEQHKTADHQSAGTNRRSLSHSFRFCFCCQTHRSQKDPKKVELSTSLTCIADEAQPRKRTTETRLNHSLEEKA